MRLPTSFFSRGFFVLLTAAALGACSDEGIPGERDGGGPDIGQDGDSPDTQAADAGKDGAVVDTGPQTCSRPSFSIDCSKVPSFQCGTIATCKDGVAQVWWHVHVLCGGSTQEQIFNYGCSYNCQNGCAVEDLGWPTSGSDLVAKACNP